MVEVLEMAVGLLGLGGGIRLLQMLWVLRILRVLWVLWVLRILRVLWVARYAVVSVSPQCSRLDVLPNEGGEGDEGGEGEGEGGLGRGSVWNTWSKRRTG